jgi:folate-binding protein YgfZ
MKRLDYLQHAGATLDGDDALHFGNPERERTRAETGAALFDLTAGTRVWIQGPDGADFLHRVLTCEVRALEPGRLTEAFLLSAQGRIELAFTLLRHEPDRFLAVGDPRLGARLRESLDQFLFAERVELIDDGESHAHFSVQGPEADAVLAAGGLPHPEAGRHAEGHLAGLPVRVWRHARSVSGGFDILAPGADFEAAFGALVGCGATPAGSQTLERLRVHAGLPRFGAEWTGESSPLEVSGLLGVTEGKGCYPGQEVIERTLALGRPPRALVSLHLADAVHAGALVLADGNEVGRITSAADDGEGGTYALALVKRRIADTDASLSVGAVAARRHAPQGD